MGRREGKSNENVSLLLSTYPQVSRRVEWGLLYPRDSGKMAEDLAIAGRVERALKPTSYEVVKAVNL
ncbi:hypothetical protein BFU36_00635 [Sulfolobus sp. A20]|uniref:hypothetical protein n=1 Tax=Sulfolobaceae TaxID=118883 RepID=UPI0008460676|nr:MULTISPECIES: hypothetical protein [unclassified Sulfolobus]AOL15485.1 hypothetical protein BFU36_00635 [Sulfolobus sp. A20]